MSTPSEKKTLSASEIYSSEVPTGIIHVDCMVGSPFFGLDRCSRKDGKEWQISD